MKSKEVKWQSPVYMHADHSYIHIRKSFYPCIYCRKTVTTKDSLIAHQVTEHPGKVFCCEQCSNVYYSKELLDEHQRSHGIEPEDNKVHAKQDNRVHTKPNILLKSPVCVKEIQPLFSNNDKVVGNGVINMDIGEKLGTWKLDTLENNPNDALPIPEDSEAEKGSADRNIQRQNEHGDMEEMRVVDVHIKPEIATPKRDVLKNTSKFSLKLSKEFENIDQNYKSKILETINKIMENNGEHTNIEADTSESMRKEAEKKLESPKTAKPVLEVEMGDKKHNTLKCNLCNHVSTSLEKYQEHNRTHLQIKFSCSYCGKQFLSQKSLSHHIYVRHTEEKGFICEWCGKHFHFWHSLRDHLCVHDKGESIFQCDKCGKEYGSKASYDSHFCGHGEASYLCDVCGKSMKYFTSLRLHRLSHIDPSSLPRHFCAICGKAYRSRYVHPLLVYQEHCS
jgi:transcription elongation factor Elf1